MEINANIHQGVMTAFYPKICLKNTWFVLELMSNTLSGGALSIYPLNDTVFIQKPDARNRETLKIQTF